MERPNEREKNFTQETIRSIISDRSMDYKNKKLEIFNLIDIIQDKVRLRVLKDIYEEQRDKPDQPNKELYDYIIDIIDRKQLKLLIIKHQNAIIQDPDNKEFYNSIIRKIEAKLASGGRRKTKRRHTKRRKSKARRKNL
jgi:hypothetical protein